MGIIKSTIENEIISFLKDFPESSALKISEAIGRSRITVSKYLSVLEAQNKVFSKKVAQARLWYVVKKKKVVLVVDDEPHIVNLIKLSLDSDKYDFLEEYTGAGAIISIKSNIPDIVVLDLMMPRVSGYDVLSEVKFNESTKSIPILVLSAKSELKDKIKAVDLGADDYLTKPFDPVELKERVSSLLEKSNINARTHRATNLMRENHLINWLKKQRKAMKNMTAYEISFGLGNKKSLTMSEKNSLLKMFSKMLKQKILLLEKDALLSHTCRDTFVVVLKNKNPDAEKLINMMLLEMKQDFKKTLPYLVSSWKNKPKLSMKVLKKDISEMIAEKTSK